MVVLVLVVIVVTLVSVSVPEAGRSQPIHPVAAKSPGPRAAVSVGAAWAPCAAAAACAAMAGCAAPPVRAPLYADRTVAMAAIRARPGIVAHFLPLVISATYGWKGIPTDSLRNCEVFHKPDGRAGI